MQEEKGYLSDEELKQLIADTESERILQAPGYLEQMIENRAGHIAVRKRTQLLAYSIKIVAAAAAAIALIITIPEIERQSADMNRQELSVKEEQREEEPKTVTQSINETTSNFCSWIFETTNELLFEREEK